MYIIDGHNLIPKIPGLSLQEIDDEERLIALLQDFCRIKRKKLDVYFDNAPPGSARRKQFGQVTAYFVRAGVTADDAIKKRLKDAGRAAKNMVVVSSDHEVQRSARYYRADVISSEAFAYKLMQIRDEDMGGKGGVGDSDIPDDDLDYYKKLFGIE